MHCGGTGHFLCRELQFETTTALNGISCSKCGRRCHIGTDCDRPKLDVCLRDERVVFDEIDFASTITFVDDQADALVNNNNNHHNRNDRNDRSFQNDRKQQQPRHRQEQFSHHDFNVDDPLNNVYNRDTMYDSNDDYDDAYAMKERGRGKRRERRNNDDYDEDDYDNDRGRARRRQDSSDPRRRLLHVQSMPPPTHQRFVYNVDEVIRYDPRGPSNDGGDRTGMFPQSHDDGRQGYSNSRRRNVPPPIMTIVSDVVNHHFRVSSTRTD
jgi:hypothetical protein